MSKIENYKRLKFISEECNQIISKSGMGCVHHSKQLDGYHMVAFAFITQGMNSNKYETSKELAEYIGEACKEFKDKIMLRVMEIAKEKAEQAKKEAKEEAEFILLETSE